ncbi:lytic murein transglycosylase [Paludibacterium paludis]|uniref:Transglycosylase-like protein with SLT domain n=1 Tax=Paludibacterium paludis TaxID=1225769 RepID=A0A918NYG7_9NEIS|nr:lytic murein transglycosylase [Paludibacterium paludis]GGY07009.1 hypothetical protein GCM10011289_07000 [Paludibacterium paludis]
MRRIIIGWLMVLPALAGGLPPNAVKYLPLLARDAAVVLPEVRPRSVFAGQIEQETCPSLASAKCWNPHAELATDREYGFGLGQLTVTRRFDNFADVKTRDRSLAGWAWSDRFDPMRQIRAMLVMDRECRRHAVGAAGDDATAMMLACYNGGGGGLRADRALCRNTPGCDPARWWGHVEKTSNKSRKKWKGYGKSAFEVNREYPHNIIRVRAPRYRPYLDEGG